MRIVAWCLILGILLGDSPSASAKSTVAEQVARIESGRKITVKLKTDEIVKGRMGNVAPDQFSVKTDHSERQIRFVEVESVKPDGLTRGEKWLIFGVVWISIGIVSKLAI